MGSMFTRSEGCQLEFAFQPCKERDPTIKFFEAWLESYLHASTPPYQFHRRLQPVFEKPLDKDMHSVRLCVYI